MWYILVADQNEYTRKKPAEFENIWVASQVEPLMDKFDILGTFECTDN